jgi:hypothetical protein
MSEFKDQVKYLLISTGYGVDCGVLSLLRDVAGMFALMGFGEEGHRRRPHCNL